MDRKELLLSREYWETRIFLTLWEINGRIEIDSDKWEEIGKKVVDKGFMDAIEEVSGFVNEELRKDKEDLQKVNSDLAKELQEANSKIYDLESKLQQERDKAVKLKEELDFLTSIIMIIRTLADLVLKTQYQEYLKSVNK